MRIKELVPTLLQAALAEEFGFAQPRHTSVNAITPSEAVSKGRDAARLRTLRPLAQLP